MVQGAKKNKECGHNKPTSTLSGFQGYDPPHSMDLFNKSFILFIIYK